MGRVAAVLIFAIAGVACSSQTDEPVDEAGRSVPDSWTSVAEEPVIELGADPSDATQQFDRIAGVVPLPGGRVAVADRSQQIRFFSITGEFLGASGGSGRGPGEMEVLFSLGSYRGDSLVVWDPPLSQVTILDDEGVMGRVVRVEPQADLPPLLFVDQPFDDGSFLLMAAPPVDREYEDGRWGAMPLVRMSEDAETFVPIAEIRLQPCRDGQVNCGRGYREFRSTWRAGDQRLFVTRPDQHEITVLDLSGEVVGSLTPPAELVPEADADQDLPSYSTLLGDAQGNVWARSGVRSERWLVFSDAGDYLGAVEGPKDLDLVAIGHGLMVGVRRDALDVERVSVYELSEGR